MALPVLLSTFGFLFIGLLVAAIIYGGNSVQVFAFLATGKYKSRRYKIYIGLIWLLNVIHFNMLSLAVLHYLVTDPLTPDSKMTKSFWMYLVLQKIIFPLTQGLAIWKIWTVTSRRQRLLVMLLAVLVLINLGAGLHVCAEVSKLVNVLDIREAAPKRAIFLNLSATSALDNIITIFLTYSFARAGAKFSLRIWIKPLVSMRVVINILLGYLAVTGPITTFLLLSLEVFLTQLYVQGAISMWTIGAPPNPPRVFIGGGPQTLHYRSTVNDAVIEIPLSAELALELRRVMAQARGEDVDSQVHEDDFKDSLPLEASDKVISLV